MSRPRLPARDERRAEDVIHLAISCACVPLWVIAVLGGFSDVRLLGFLVAPLIGGIGAWLAIPVVTRGVEGTKRQALAVIAVVLNALPFALAAAAVLIAR